MRACLPVILIFILFSCSPNNVTRDKSLEKFFTDNNVEGCFALFDNGSGEFTVHNLERYRDSAYLPASTFKMLNSLIGLQTGVIVNDSMIISWDKKDHGQPDCNRDLSMYQAFRLSCLPWYQEVARRIGKETMQKWVDSISYGNKKISIIDSFWLDNSLKITPDEQLGFVKRLYFNQLPFHKYNQEIVKKAMLMEDTPNYKLSYKTGWGRKEDGKSVAWIAGWVEENKHPYLFVLNFETADKNADIAGIRLNMLKGMLRHLGFLEGKR